VQKDPWIKNHDPNFLKTELFTNIANRVAAFKKTSSFQASVLNFMAGVCETKGREGAMVDVDLAFNELDKKGDGKITKEHFVSTMKERLPHLVKYDWNKYFGYVDTRNNGFIDYD
jgi:Ca2+-binding EF-hand superfamily protein